LHEDKGATATTILTWINASPECSAQYIKSSGGQWVKKILVAHDLSRRSSIAVARAVQLAQQTGAVLDILHVVEDDLPLTIIERRKAEATEVVNADLAALRATASRIEVHVLVGRDYTDILDRAEKSAADLIVLGAHREDALRGLVIGTTAERIIGFGTRPVLVVNSQPAGQYRRVIVAVDFSSSARQAAAFAFDLLPEAEFRLLHASSMAADGRFSSGANTGKAEKIKSDLSAYFPCVGAHAASKHLVVRHGSALAVIRDEVTDFNAEVLVVGAQRRSGLTRALIGEILEDLLARPPCDIIAVHA
jgi:nucleotide-binding universal stress UspA family protein